MPANIGDLQLDPTALDNRIYPVDLRLGLVPIPVIGSVPTVTATPQDTLLLTPPAVGATPDAAVVSAAPAVADSGLTLPDAPLAAYGVTWTFWILAAVAVWFFYFRKRRK